MKTRNGVAGSDRRTVQENGTENIYSNTLSVSFINFLLQTNLNKMNKEQAEIERIQAEKEKILAEKRTIEKEAKHYWHKPIITGITFAITGLGVLLFLFNTSYDQLQQANALEISIREYENTKTKDSILVKKQEINFHKEQLKAKENELTTKEKELDSLLQAHANAQLKLKQGQADLKKSIEMKELADKQSEMAQQSQKNALVNRERARYEYQRLKLSYDSLNQALTICKGAAQN